MPSSKKLNTMASEMKRIGSIEKGECLKDYLHFTS